MSAEGRRIRAAGRTRNAHVVRGVFGLSDISLRQSPILILKPKMESDFFCWDSDSTRSLLEAATKVRPITFYPDIGRQWNK